MIAELEKPLFRLKSGCAFCHHETSRPDARPNGLPEYAFPHIRDRWRDVVFPVERFGLAGRGFGASTLTGGSA